MFTIYILFSQKIGKFFVGYTNNLNRIIAEQNRVKGKFTDMGIPWKLVSTESFPAKSEAMDREKEIKSKKSRNYIETLISS
jgi:putative endonuclease